MDTLGIECQAAGPAKHMLLPGVMSSCKRPACRWRCLSSCGACNSKHVLHCAADGGWWTEKLHDADAGLHLPPRRRKSARDVLRAALYTIGLASSLPPAYAQ